MIIWGIVLGLLLLGVVVSYLVIKYWGKENDDSPVNFNEIEKEYGESPSAYIFLSGSIIAGELVTAAILHKVDTNKMLPLTITNQGRIQKTVRGQWLFHVLQILKSIHMYCPRGVIILFVPKWLKRHFDDLDVDNKLEVSLVQALISLEGLGVYIKFFPTYKCDASKTAEEYLRRRIGNV